MNKFLIFSYLIFFQIGQASENRNIPIKDKQKLEYFFQFLITKTSFGYTLCEHKPCSIETYPSLSNFPPIPAVKVIFKFPAYSLLSHGWDTWSKYADLFPSQRFVFRYNSKFKTLILINKSLTKKIIEENLDLFQKYSKSNLSAEQFLEEICHPQDDHNDYLIKKHMTLLGILLGYGRNNSIAFTQKSDVQLLKRFNLDEGPYILKAIYDPSFMSIQNGTNEEENKKIKRGLIRAKENIKNEFRNQLYFENFVRLFSREMK